eukprot:546007-Pyramimonas_sp.AAC.1
MPRILAVRPKRPCPAAVGSWLLGRKAPSPIGRPWGSTVRPQPAWGSMPSSGVLLQSRLLLRPS